MAFVNLPPNLQDMFNSLSDRIAKLETGPNQAMYTAVAADGTAQEAYLQALNASAQATQATYEAGIAVQSANGKSVSHYSSSAPGSTPGNNGDIWFQVNSSTGVVEYQYIYNSGSWNEAPIANTVISNLDAGKITAGTITGIAYNNGSGTFTVSSLGALVATSATIQGIIRGNSGYFTGTLTSSAGTIGGFDIGTTYLKNATGSIRFNSDTATATVNGLTSTQSINVAGITNSGVLSMGGNNINNAGTISSGAITSSGDINATSGAVNAFTLGITNSASFANGSTSTSFQALSSGTLRSLYTYGIARSSSTRTMIIDSVGNFGTTASTRRKKQNIENYAIDSNALLQLPVRTFKYKPEIDPEQQVQHGFIAEEAQDLGLDELIQYDASGIPDYFAYEKLPIFLLQLVQEQDKRIKELESKIQ